MSSTHTHRYIARFVVEAETPLFVGSGQTSLLKDALVAKDCNGFPMIPGTSITGILRHALEGDESHEEWQSIFGHKEAQGSASRLRVSPAMMMLNASTCSEGIIDFDDANTYALNRYSTLPSRQHVRINDKGVSQEHGLFDNEIVYKGTRFIFELELRGTENDMNEWSGLMHFIHNPTFRIGSGTRNGYGKLKVIRSFTKIFDLRILGSFHEYLDFNPSLNSGISWDNSEQKTTSNSNYARYQLFLKPDSFFIFSEGFGDDEVDNKPKEEEIVYYKSDGLYFSNKNTLSPASSVKGALSHRVAFHFNRLNQNFESNGKISSDNLAVYELFGEMGGASDREPKAGNIFMDDLYFSEDEMVNDKIFNHVAIDRFTGGALHGALFSEKVSSLLNNELHISVFVKQNNYSAHVIQALENALQDICMGLLPLGGMTTKGNGMFTGRLLRDGEELFNYMSN